MYLGVIAVADLGSNSFKLEIAQIKSGRPVTTETLKESVRLGGGVTKSGMLSKSAMKRGWDALSKFGSRLRGFDPHSNCCVCIRLAPSEAVLHVWLAY